MHDIVSAVLYIIARSACGHMHCDDKAVEKVAKIRGDILKIGRQTEAIKRPR